MDALSPKELAAEAFGRFEQEFRRQLRPFAAVLLRTCAQTYDYRVVASAVGHVLFPVFRGWLRALARCAAEAARLLGRVMTQ